MSAVYLGQSLNNLVRCEFGYTISLELDPLQNVYYVFNETEYYEGPLPDPFTLNSYIQISILGSGDYRLIYYTNDDINNYNRCLNTCPINYIGIIGIPSSECSQNCYNLYHSEILLKKI